jgi:predicted phosphodiesterase
MAWPFVTPDRVLVVGDTHAHIEAFTDTVIPAAKLTGASVLLHVGDLGLYTGNEENDASFSEELDGLLMRHGLFLLAIDGNHDTWLHRNLIGVSEPTAIGERLWYMPRGFACVFGDCKLLFVGGGYSVDEAYRRSIGHYHEWEELREIDVERACQSGGCDLMVAHDCAAGIDLSWHYARILGSGFHKSDLRTSRHRQKVRRIVAENRPSLLVHGHYHVPYEDRLVVGRQVVRVSGLNCDGWQGSVGAIELSRRPRFRFVATDSPRHRSLRADV